VTLNTKHEARGGRRGAMKPEALAAAAEDTLASIGQRVRELRAAKGFTLQDLGARTSLSPSMLSLVERGKTMPSIGSLIVICSALGVHMADLLAPEGLAARDPVSRVAKQPIFETAKGVMRRLLRENKALGVEIAINEYAPQRGNSPTPVQHSGYEFGIVLEGELTVTLDGVSHVLTPGDLISYDSMRGHKILNNGSQRVRALWINLNRSAAAT
jgi:transcriptional regulator with XRE-family HTH domain